MRTTNLHDATFEKIRAGLSSRQRDIYRAWIIHGPVTTRRLAALGEMDLLNVRPRTTELVRFGLIELTGHSHGEGTYRARSEAEWNQWSAAQREHAAKPRALYLQ